MRLQAYWLTFMGYLMLHVLRTGYSFSKPYFKKAYDLSNPFVAVIDATIYFSLGLGFLLRPLIVRSNKSSLLKFFITTTLAAVGYMLFPFFSLSHILTSGNAEPIIFVSMVIYGFFQLNIWPNMLAIVKDHYTNKDGGCMIGFWGAAGDFGNILGFLLPPIFVVQAGLAWEIPLLIFGGILILVAFGIYAFVERNEEHQKQQENSCSQSWKFAQEAFSKVDVVMYIMIGCCYKALLYTFLLWLPTYLDDKGQKSLSSQIPVIFNVATIFGSFMVGHLYEDTSFKCCKHAPQYVLAFLGLIVTGCLVIIVNANFSPLLFGFMIAIEGFAIGAVFNVIATNQTIRLSKQNPAVLSKLTTLLMGLSNSFIGLVELIVGVSLAGDSNTPGSTYDSVFKVLLVLSILSSILLVARAYRTYHEPENDQHIKLEDSQ